MGSIESGRYAQKFAKMGVSFYTPIRSMRTESFPHSHEYLILQSFNFINFSLHIMIMYCNLIFIALMTDTEHLKIFMSVGCLSFLCSICSNHLLIFNENFLLSIYYYIVNIIFILLIQILYLIYIF